MSLFFNKLKHFSLFFILLFRIFFRLFSFLFIAMSKIFPHDFADADDGSFAMAFTSSLDGGGTGVNTDRGTGFLFIPSISHNSPRRSAESANTCVSIPSGLRCVPSVDRLKEIFQDLDNDSYGGYDGDDALQRLEEMASEDEVRHTQGKTRSFFSSTAGANEIWAIREQEGSLLQMIDDSRDATRGVEGFTGGSGGLLGGEAGRCYTEEMILGEREAVGKNVANGDLCVPLTSSASPPAPPPYDHAIHHSATSALINAEAGPTFRTTTSHPPDPTLSQSSLLASCPVFMPPQEAEGTAQRGGEPPHGGSPLGETFELAREKEKGEEVRPTFSVSAMDSSPSHPLSTSLPPPPPLSPGHLSASTPGLLGSSLKSNGVSANGSAALLSPSLNAVYPISVPHFSDFNLVAGGGTNFNSTSSSTSSSSSAFSPIDHMHHHHQPPHLLHPFHPHRGAVGYTLGGALSSNSSTGGPSSRRASVTPAGAGGNSQTNTPAYLGSPGVVPVTVSAAGGVGGNSLVVSCYPAVGGSGNSPSFVPLSPPFTMGSHSSSNGAGGGMMMLRRSKPPPPSYEEAAGVSSTGAAAPLHGRSPEISPLSGALPPYYGALPPPPPPPPLPPPSSSMTSVNGLVVGGAAPGAAAGTIQPDTLLVRNHHGVFLLHPTSLKPVPPYTPPVSGSGVRAASSGTGRTTPPPSPLPAYYLPPSASTGMGGRHSLSVLPLHVLPPPPPPAALPPSALDPTAAAFVTSNTSTSGAAGGGAGSSATTPLLSRNTSFSSATNTNATNTTTTAGGVGSAAPYFLPGASMTGTTSSSAMNNNSSPGGGGTHCSRLGRQRFTPTGTTSFGGVTAASPSHSFPPPYMGSPPPHDLTSTVSAEW